MDFAIAGIIIGPIIVGLVEVFKRTGLPNKYAPALAVSLGLLAGISAKLGGEVDGSWPFFITIGIMEGLVSSGLYSGVKTTLK